MTAGGISGCENLFAFACPTRKVWRTCHRGGAGATGRPRSAYEQRNWAGGLRVRFREKPAPGLAAEGSIIG